jgi:hypothetical protein
MNEISEKDVVRNQQGSAWQKIIDLVRSKNVVPEGVSDETIRNTVLQVYGYRDFYPKSDSFAETFNERLKNPEFLNIVLARIDRIPEYTGGPSLSEKASLRTHLDARFRFDSMPGPEQETYRGRAREVLPPIFYNDPEAVLFTALELMVHDEALRRTGCEKRISEFSKEEDVKGGS